MKSSRIFAVTGSNKGIGKSIVKRLLRDNEKKIVYLTSRDVEAGEQAVKDLQSEGVHPYYHQLDITNEESIKQFRHSLMKKHGGLDVLINNAGISFAAELFQHIGLDSYPAKFAEATEMILATNFYGTLSTCNLLFPILKNDARVVNITSVWCEIIYREVAEVIRDKFRDENLTMEGIKDLMSQFLEDTKDFTDAGQRKCKHLYAYQNKISEKMWSSWPYGMSKIALTLMTILQQKELNESPDKNVSVNCCCPGFVVTDMSRQVIRNISTALSADEAADTPVYLAHLPKDSEIKGCYVKLKKVVPFPPGDVE